MQNPNIKTPLASFSTFLRIFTIIGKYIMLDNAITLHDNSNVKVFQFNAVPRNFVALIQGPGVKIVQP